MEEVAFSKQEIANYLINRSFLNQKSNALLDIIDFYKGLQVDPINVVARNHELILWNRVNNFKKEDLYNEIYKSRNLFEYWFQLFSIIPIKYYPYFSARFNIKDDWQEEFYKTHKKEINLP